LVDFSQKKLGNEFQNLSKSSLEKIKKAYMFIGFMRFFSHKYIYIPRKQEETSKKNKQEIDDLFKDLLSWSGKII
jgi:predicted transcriptional regulator